MPVKFSKFDQPTLDETIRQLAEHMPQGRAWNSKASPDSKLRIQMSATATPFNVLQGRIGDLSVDFRIPETLELLQDWEKSVGLPDKCADEAATLTDRRNLVQNRLARRPQVTLADHQAIVDRSFPGKGIKLYPGLSTFQHFEYEFEFPFGGTEYDRFVLVAEVPQNAVVDEQLLKCILRRVVPANVLPLILKS